VIIPTPEEWAEEQLKNAPPRSEEWAKRVAPADLSLIVNNDYGRQKKRRKRLMTSMSDFAGQSLIWVKRRGYNPGGYCFDLRAADNSVIATFPLEALGRNVGIAGIRFHEAKAVVFLPDGKGGTGIGTLLLNEEDGDIVIYIGTQGRVPDGDFRGESRLAIYKESLGFTQSRLEFHDGTTFRWDRWPGKSGKSKWVDEAGTAHVVIHDGDGTFHFFEGDFRVDILPSAAKMSDQLLSLLLVLGVYNMNIENTTRFLEDYGPAKQMQLVEDFKKLQRWWRREHGG